MQSTLRAPAAPSSRRPRVPPALTRGADRFDGLGILSEIAGDLGLLLWRSVRNVVLWAETPPTERAALFAAPAAGARRDDAERLGMDPELLAPVSVIVSLLERPDEVDALRLVNACRRVALWAEQRGALATALEFAQAAALAVPDSAALAYAVGRLARRRAEHDRAESWYTRAFVQGRETKDWKSSALAVSGLGNVHIRKGNLPAARKAFRRCLRIAERHGLLELQGDAYHDLFAVEVEGGAGFEADPLAEAAFRAYGPRHRKVPRLAYDVAYHWVVQGFAHGAFRVSRALLPHFDTVAERALVLGLLARAAGARHERAEFDSAAFHAARLVAGKAAPDAAARTYLGLAYGALSLEEWELAAGWAADALRVSRARGEGKIVLEAEDLREAVEERRSEHAQRITAEPAWSGALAEGFVGALSRPAVAAAG